MIKAGAGAAVDVHRL